ncbi:MAG: hypothetical protein K6G26_11225 [Lachnospiraceae bacterium]|nr:hypothetical protein [Lachnospiraceae bacterium]
MEKINNMVEINDSAQVPGGIAGNFNGYIEKIKSGINTKADELGFDNINTKANILSGFFMLMILVSIIFAIVVFCGREDTEILGKAQFGDDMSVVAEKTGDNYNTYVDLESQMMVYEYSDYEINGVKGQLLYYFSSEGNTLKEARFIFEPKKKSVSRIRSYMRSHYGKPIEIAAGSWSYEGKTVDYTIENLISSGMEQVYIKQIK